LRIALAAAALLSAPIAEAWAAPALWVAKSATAKIYLFGTMHLLDPDMDWRTPKLDAAYKEADTIWFETDVAAVSDRKVATDLLNRYGYDADHPLTTKLDAEHASALKAVAAHYRLSMGVVERLKPWAAAMMLIALPMMEDGLDAGSGADVQLNGSAASDRKTIRTFETVDQQVHFFADMTPDAEVQFLDSTIDENLRTSHGDVGLEAIWASGDIEKLGPAITGEMKARYPELYETLILRRNQAWADVLAKELQSRGVELVNVGALHMVGDEGLPALLKARGFTVERLQ
jgi:uncharacterized protein YbaP (TraB family)